jgi:hypothetical protein
MPVHHNKCKYQLIHPVVGTRVYQTTSLKKGAKKCYEELKSLNNIDAAQFSVLNVDTYETYHFQIDDSHKLSGGGASLGLELNQIQSAIESIDSRLQKLEKLNGIDDDKRVTGAAGGAQVANETMDPDVDAGDMAGDMADALGRNITPPGQRRVMPADLTNQCVGEEQDGQCVIM